MSRVERRLHTKPEKKANISSYVAQATKLMEAARFQEAKSMLEDVLKRTGDQVDVLNLLGTVSYRLGDANQSISYYKRLLDIDPAHTEALRSLANLLLNLGYQEQAVEMYESVLTHDPKHGAALKTLNKIYAESERWPETFITGKRLLKDQPWHDDVWQRMMVALPHVPVSFLNEEFMQQMIEALDNSATNPIPAIVLSLQAIGVAFPMLAACLGGINNEGIQSVEHITISQFKVVLDVPLLREMLRRHVVPHQGLELLMTLIRARFLMLPEEERLEDYYSELLTLARQGFLNEYIYYQTPEEQKLVANLKTEMESSLLEPNSKTVCKLLLLASYIPPSSMAFAEALPTLAKKYPDKDFHDFIAMSVSEVLEERRIVPTIQTIGTISDSVSQAVQGQYEENPYPRWLDYGRFPPETTVQVMRRLFPRFDMTLIVPSASPQILIGGCGTGKHGVGVARRFGNSKVTAVDLSRASLSYAFRKTREYKIDNIDYYQADILNLGEMNQQFDVVESVGVLHHMRDPMAGWKVLVDLLKLGGIMKIGLYSAKARESITAMREEIASKGIKDSLDAIRVFRHELFQDPNLAIKLPFSRSRDFYSTSECRDLLFHRQEHCTTLPELKEKIDDLGLKFMGFEMANTALIGEYITRFPEDKYWNNLDNWHQMEQEMPHIFGGMYQFWCYKPL